MNDSNEVKLHFLDYWRVIRVRWAVMLITFLLVMVTAGITCFFLPRQFYSKFLMEVKSDYSGDQIFGGEAIRYGGGDANLAPTQFKILTSKEILYPVIENLKLPEQWSAKEGGRYIPREEIYGRLLGRLKLEVARGTNMFEVGCYSTDPQEAANIANMIFVVYQEVRRSTFADKRNRYLRQLHEAVEAQKKSLTQQEAKLIEIRERDGIIDNDPTMMGIGMTGQGIANTLTASDHQKYSDDLNLRNALQVRMDNIAKLTTEQVIQSAATLGLNEPTILNHVPLYNGAVSEEAQLLNSGLGEKHPRIVSLRARKAAYLKILAEAVEGLRKSMAIQIEEVNARLTTEKAKIDQNTKAINDANKTNAEYVKLKSDYMSARRTLEEMEKRYTNEYWTTEMQFDPAKLWEKAEKANAPAKPNIWFYMSIATIIGISFGLGLAFFMEYLDTSVKTLDDVEHFLGAPVLAVIPKGVTSLFGLKGDAPDAEAYRILRTNMEFNCKNPNARTITMISGGPGEGKSTTLNNLAVTCAKGGYNVLIVDADLRRPSQHTFMGIDNEEGLAQVLMGECNLEDAIHRTAMPNLSFMPSGFLPQEAVGVLNSQTMIDLIDTVRRHYDLVFFDAPPILGVSDASILVSEVDITIMVVQYRRFPRTMLARVKAAVENVGGNLLGVVLNNVETQHDSGYQYYTQYYDYYSTPSYGGKGGGYGGGGGYGSGYGKRQKKPSATAQALEKPARQSKPSRPSRGSDTYAPEDY